MCCGKDANWKKLTSRERFKVYKSFQITCDKRENRSRSLIKALALVFTARAKKRERDVFWSDDARAEEKNRSERLVGCDCEQRRYLFQTHFAEVESN